MSLIQTHYLVMRHRQLFQEECEHTLLLRFFLCLLGFSNLEKDFSVAELRHSIILHLRHFEKEAD